MKKLSVAALILVTCFIFSAASAQTVHHTAHAKRPTAADIAAGKALFLKSDCLSCHKMDIKLVGPAYYDVAKKYPPTEANYEMLASKVISGGSGVWGQVAMAPHPTITHDDAKKIVEYILSLKPGKS
jgi:cytochrome c